MVYLFDDEMNFLEELAEDPADGLRVIAYVHPGDTKFIRRRQKAIQKRYERFLEDVDSDTGVLRIIPAYDSLMGLLEGNPSPEDIKEDCEAALANYLWDDPEELSEDCHKPFEGFI